MKAGGTFSESTLVAVLKAIDIGSLGGEPSPLAIKVQTLFASADIQSRLRSDMLHYLWVQYAISGGPWAALVKAGSFDAMLNDRGATLEMLRPGCECLQVVRQRGVDFSLYAEAKPFLTNPSLHR